MFTPAFLRRTATVLLVTVTSLTMQPLQAAVQAERLQAGRGNSAAKAATQPQTAAETRGERMSRALGDVDDIVKEVGPQTQVIKPAKTKASKKKAAPAKTQIILKPLPGVKVEEHVKQLREKHKELKVLEDAAEQDFADTEQHIKDAKLPQVIVERQKAAVQEFRKRRAEFDRLLTDVEDADATNKAVLPVKLKALSDFMDQHPNHKVQRPVDPNKLPFSRGEDKVRPPKKTEREYHASLFKPEPVMLAGPIPNGFTMPATTLPYTPTAADLAPTEDIVLTPAIKALASSLNNNPVQIYNWVRNNIEYIPTYGSIQGADMTLLTKRGNDMDTASLLIALFRAANIPARYVYGTIQLPADQAMNWVGGVTTPDAAVQLMGQGGIPSIGLVAGGVIKYIQLEHVWVEAYVDYTPSRGAINKNPDTWVVMDPSFKQYTYTQGMNIQANVPFDAQALATQAQAGATVNSGGWVQNLNASAAQAALTAYQLQLQTYLSTTNPNATVGDVIGTKTVIPENHPILLGTLPYKTIATGAELSGLPVALRHSISIDLYADAMSQAAGTPSLSYSLSLPNIAGKKIALVYQAASAADQAVIDAAIAGNQTKLPAYLIQTMPVLKIEGSAVSVGQVVTMGTPQIMTVNLTSPWYSRSRDYSITAGDLSLLGVNAAGVTNSMFNARTSQHDLSKGVDSDFTAEMFYQVILGYWNENFAFNDVIAATNNVATNQLPSHGVAAAPLSIAYNFGIPTTATYKSRAMDIQDDHVAAVHQANDPELLRRFMLAHGQVASYLEAGIYDQAFLMKPGYSMSSVTIIKASNDMGIPIYTIDQTNAATALPQLAIGPDAIADIQNAIAAGKRVTVPQRNITVGTFTGTGYILEDTTTGTGAYMISGGRNGNSSAAGEFVYPLPQIPSNMLIGMMAGSSLRNAGAKLVAENGMIVGIVFAAQGGTIGGTGTGGSGGGAAALGALAVIFMLLSAFQSNMDQKYPPKTTPDRYRKYSSSFDAVRNAVTFSIRQTTDPNASYGNGIYLALQQEPQLLGGATVGCGPSMVEAEAIATAYQIPNAKSPPQWTMASAYVDISITRDGYYNIQRHANANGVTEVLITDPLLPVFEVGGTFYYLYFGPYSMFVEFGELCL